MMNCLPSSKQRPMPSSSATRPSAPPIWGPVINQSSYNDFKNFTEEINGAGGKFLTGGHVKTGGIYDKGYFCEPTFVTDLPFEHRLWQYEMFLPITTIGKVSNLDEAMKIANDVNYGLTAGFYGSPRKPIGSSTTSKQA